MCRKKMLVCSILRKKAVLLFLEQRDWRLASGPSRHAADEVDDSRSVGPNMGELSPNPDAARPNSQSESKSHHMERTRKMARDGYIPLPNL